jgi:hypothetical protein
MSGGFVTEQVTAKSLGVSPEQFSISIFGSFHAS